MGCNIPIRIFLPFPSVRSHSQSHSHHAYDLIPIPVPLPNFLPIPSHSNSRLTNERHLSLNNQTMISTELWSHVTRNKRYSTLLASIRIESTNGNFGTHEKVAIPIPIVTCTLPVPIPIYGIFVFPFPWDSRGNPWESHSHAHLYRSDCAQSQDMH